jgi:hypothetical protein
MKGKKALAETRLTVGLRRANIDRNDRQRFWDFYWRTLVENPKAVDDVVTVAKRHLEDRK